jgi:hypothetical protein
LEVLNKLARQISMYILTGQYSVQPLDWQPETGFTQWYKLLEECFADQDNGSDVRRRNEEERKKK